MKHLFVDFDRITGKIKPMHGVNNGPVTGGFRQDARPYFKEARIPFSRLHDTEYPFGAGEYVDVHCLFKNFNCDENDPENYNFALTDEYFKYIDECGTKIIYRLGTTIEHQPVKIHTVPPKDYLKWARICEHIIMHYNEGWANGMRLGIEYWEIWNEPDGGAPCWDGSWEEYGRFYVTVATYLKERFPHLKIGGPANSYALNEFSRRFFEMITADGKHPPLDFYSWHGYLTDPRLAQKMAAYTDGLLKEFGYENAESIYDEWNYVDDWNKVSECYKVISSMKGAAFDAAMLIALQHSPCDISTFYDAQSCMTAAWNGLFSPAKEMKHATGGSVGLKKGYYSFKAFGTLYGLGQEVHTEIEDGNIWSCAAAGDGKAVMLVNYHDTECKPEKVQVKLAGGEKMKVYRLCGTKNLEEIGEIEGEGTLTLPRYSVILLTDR